MSEYERTRTMPVMPELVFNQVSDPDSLNRWLPTDLHARVEDPPAVTVHEDRTGHDVRALYRTRPEQMRAEWGTRDQGSYAGWLQVAGIGSGASEVTVHLSFFDEEHAPPEESVNGALDQSLERLAEQVRARTEHAD
ncbi:SRPBCC family protein [Streptomyces sp. TRM 70361]|uniref:SRPBCC family protein n=1 Tax=Streptomyces sp. TRM 70361 TaxID=3116553 RepID=UPI002E7BAB0B|nr:SRPBCC family protein [Streptomyces sp. TRM 70361]MEE1941231.1 SRPBCC family protein [Streptomyces sp. TRM 70361]